jgi:hypothetical protein
MTAQTASPPTSCLDGAWPCFEHDEHVLKAGRYSYGTTPEDYGPGDWEPNPYTAAARLTEGSESPEQRRIRNEPEHSEEGWSR